MTANASHTHNMQSLKFNTFHGEHFYSFVVHADVQISILVKTKIKALTKGDENWMWSKFSK